jgi:hypothetical protein
MKSLPTALSESPASTIALLFAADGQVSRLRQMNNACGRLQRRGLTAIVNVNRDGHRAGRNARKGRRGGRAGLACSDRREAREENLRGQAHVNLESLHISPMNRKPNSK